jgi:hypothetical protein
MNDQGLPKSQFRERLSETETHDEALTEMVHQVRMKLLGS